MLKIYKLGLRGFCFNIVWFLVSKLIIRIFLGLKKFFIQIYMMFLDYLEWKHVEN